MYKGVIPFIALQLVGLVIVGFNPALVNYLPTKTFLSSETAPPPKNPRLQLCLEDYLFEFYANNETAYNAGLDRLKATDLSVLPLAKQQALASNIQTAGMVFDLVANIKNAKLAMADAAVSYAPVHTEVRAIERGIRQGEAKIKQLQRELRATDRVSKRNKIQNRIVALKNDIASQRKLIPSSWQSTNKDFKKLTAQLNASRVKLRRQSDQAYADIRMLVTSLESEAELKAIGETVRQIRVDMLAAPPADLLRRVKASYNELSRMPDVDDAVKALSDARSMLNDPSPDRQKAVTMLDATLAIIDRELTWRSAAKTTLYIELSAFESFARFNLGLREQDRLTQEQVDIITPCLAEHRNLALQF